MSYFEFATTRRAGGSVTVRVWQKHPRVQVWARTFEPRPHTAVRAGAEYVQGTREDPRQWRLELHTELLVVTDPDGRAARMPLRTERNMGARPASSYIG